MRKVRAIWCLVLVALAVTACSGTTEDVAAADGAAPFDAVLLELFGTTDTEQYLVDAERTAAELVVACMNEAGFEFEIPPETVITTIEGDGTLDFARESGFGIIAGFRQQLADPDLVTQVQDDPNVAYLSTLSGAEIDRFFLTLDGEQVEAGQRRSGEDGGCNGAASDEAYADWLRFFEALPNYTVIGEERDTHPDWLVARQLWHDCMVERGLDYSEPDEIRTDVIARMRDTVEAIYPGGQLPMLEIDGRLVVDPEVDVLLDELTAFEVRAAVADIECTEPIADRFDAVNREVQQAFVDRNRAAIDGLLAAN